MRKYSNERLIERIPFTRHTSASCIHTLTFLSPTHASKPNTTQFKQLTLSVAITSSLPPISHTYFTTSRCPLEQADMRQVRPSCKRWPSDHHHTLSPQP